MIDVPLYVGTLLTRERLLPGPYSRTLPRVIQRTWGGSQFLMSEVAIYPRNAPMVSQFFFSSESSFADWRGNVLLAKRQ